MNKLPLTVVLIVLVLALMAAAKLKWDGTYLAGIAAAGLVLTLLLARRRSSVQGGARAGVLTAILLGSGVLLGSFVPAIPLTFLPFGLLVLLAVFFVLGAPELMLLRRWLSASSAAARLNGQRFPFFALGVAIGLALRM